MHEVELVSVSHYFLAVCSLRWSFKLGPCLLFRLSVCLLLLFLLLFPRAGEVYHDEYYHGTVITVESLCSLS